MTLKILGRQGNNVIVDSAELDAFKDDLIQKMRLKIELLEEKLDELVTYLMILEVLEPNLSEDIRKVLAEHVDYSKEEPKIALC